MKFILGKKVGMTQRFLDDGTVVPVSIVEAGPCVVTQVRTKERDGYHAVQIGFGKKRRLSKALRGHLRDRGDLRWLREFRLQEADASCHVGGVIRCTTFQDGDIVHVRGIAKGKGFQGVVKRHGFHGSPASHGHKDQLRMPGSIGAGGVQRAPKGKRMGGRMGGQQVTVKNLRIVHIDADQNQIWVHGAIPGARNTLLLLSAPGAVVFDVPADTLSDAVVTSPSTEHVETAEKENATPEESQSEEQQEKTGEQKNEKITEESVDKEKE